MPRLSARPSRRSSRTHGVWPRAALRLLALLRVTLAVVMPRTADAAGRPHVGGRSQQGHDGTTWRSTAAQHDAATRLTAPLRRWSAGRHAVTARHDAAPAPRSAAPQPRGASGAGEHGLRQGPARPEGERPHPRAEAWGASREPAYAEVTPEEMPTYLAVTLADAAFGLAQGGRGVLQLHRAWRTYRVAAGAGTLAELTRGGGRLARGAELVAETARLLSVWPPSPP